MYSEVMRDRAIGLQGPLPRSSVKVEPPDTGVWGMTGGEESVSASVPGVWSCWELVVAWRHKVWGGRGSGRRSVLGGGTGWGRQSGSPGGGGGGAGGRWF